MSRAARLLTIAALALLLGASSAQGVPLPGAPSCSIFPSNNWWNQRVDSLPVASNSAAVINTIGRGLGLYADFGSGLWNGSPIGIPITVVPGSQAKVRVSFQYAGESGPGPSPVPLHVTVAG